MTTPSLTTIIPSAVVWTLLFLLQQSPVSLAHEAACHVCTGDVDARPISAACQLLIFAADDLNDVAGSECQGIQYRGVTEGCCDTPTNFCNLCEQGGNLPDPDLRISTLTCAEVGGLASFVPDDSACTDFQATYGEYCGCSNPIATQSSCSICENRGQILHRKIVPAPQFQVEDGPSNRFCGVLEYFAQFTSVPFATCAEYQDAFADQCCSPMTAAPVVSPTEVPVAAPTESPVVTPTEVPVVATVPAPVAVPIAVPSVLPVQPPVAVAEPTMTTAAPEVSTAVEPTDAPAVVTAQPVVVSTPVPGDAVVEVSTRSAARGFQLVGPIMLFCLGVANFH